MSIKIMSKIWENGPSDKTQLLVLLALSDFSNDEGECWPSMRSIAKKSRLTERGCQKVLRALEADGWINIQTGGGRHGCNIYVINPEPETPNEVRPEQGSPRTREQKPRTRVQETLNGGSPEPLEPSRTVNKDHSFSEFWKLWPNKVGKYQAEKAWKKMNGDDRWEAICQIQRWFSTWRKQNPQASPIHAATYLNQKRWEDKFHQGQIGASDEMDRWKRMAAQ